MKIKQKFGQFYTKNSKYIIGNLIKNIPLDATIIDPFAGELDLLKIMPQKDQLSYDIDPKQSITEKRDTLLNPPDYKNKWVITNPPYLARNKNKDKIIYEKYNVNDLYKAAILSILDCNGGILVIPLNFFSDEDNFVRKIFLKKFVISSLNIFEEQVFEDTTYTICSFYFQKNNNDNSIIYTQKINTKFYPSLEEKIFITNSFKANNFTQDGYDPGEGFRIGGEFYNMLRTNTDIKVSRLLKNKKQEFITNINLRAIDTGSNSGRICLEISDKHYYGKLTDRAFATIIISKKYSIEEQKIITTKFNEILEENRKKYNSLFLTNFRNSTKKYARKRISFETAYNLIKYVIVNFIETNKPTNGNIK